MNMQYECLNTDTNAFLTGIIITIADTENITDMQSKLLVSQILPRPARQKPVVGNLLPAIIKVSFEWV